MAAPSTRVIVALSGGSDSMALAHLLAALSRSGELVLVGLAHFNHQLRPEADADERLCADTAASLSLPLVADRSDVRALARRERRSIEDAARMARHAFLERARVEFRADVVAFGHTQDDQAETFLLRLVRGAGSAGLGGMYPRRGVIVRPVIECRRANLQDYLQQSGVRFATDATNRDVTVPRNRIRAELIPFLQDRFNPAIVKALASEAALLRDEQSFMREQSSEWLAAHAEQRRGETRIAVADLLDAPAPVARMAIERAMRTVARGRQVGFEHAEHAFDLARDEGAPFDAPGQHVQRIEGQIVLISREGRRVRRFSPPRANLFEYLLSIPGETRIAESGVVIAARVGGSDQLDTSNNLDIGCVHVPPQFWPLKVRPRRPGDHFQPLGMAGRKKLQDFFVDRKVAREARDRVPIVVDATDRIVWVAGHRIEHAFRVQDPSQPVIILRLKAVGGSV